MLPTATSFWGPPTATVDWCEANYAHTPYVAELFNTASSLAMVTAGIVGLIAYRRTFNARHLAAFLLLALVGVGSVAFHGTLRFELQMMDELPMVYLVIWMVYLLVEDGPTPRFGPWFLLALASYACLVTYLCVFTRGRVEFFVFQFGFGALELFCMGRVYLLQRQSPEPEVRRLFSRGMGAYVLGIAVWFVDLKLCDVVSITLPRHGIPNPELHAVWHVLVSYGFYSLLVLVAREARRRAPEPAES
jgi:dihydroceramidase